MQPLSQIFLKKDFVFIASFIALRLLFEFQLKLLALWSGATHAYLHEVVQDNELVLQVLSLLGAFILVNWKEVNSPGILGRILSPAFWEKIYRTKISHIEWRIVGRGLFRGFLLVSGIIAFSIFLGVGQLEVGALKVDSFLRLSPFLFSELLLLAVWVLFVELGRTLFWRSVMKFQSSNVAQTWGTVLVVGWETWILFQVLNGSVFLKDQVVTWIFCSVIAGAMLLWTQLGDSHFSERMKRKERLFRLSFIFAVFISYFHIYGQPFGYSRQVSLYYFVNESFSEIGSFAEKGPSGQAISLIVVAFLVNALLQRYMRKEKMTSAGL